MQEGMRNLSIFILGTTAVGKTKLSLELCKYLNGQIVSCDSKQLYKHANLMTAKSTPQQLKLFKHNMVDCLELQQNSYNRNKYFEQVKSHTNRIWKQGKTPIFIGGTNYYLEPILYNVQDLGKINNQNKKQQNPSLQTQNKGQTSQKEEKNIDWIKKLTKEEKYQKLKQVDPMMAQKLHKNDQTRITSFLQRFYKNNKKPSQSYKPYTNQLNNQNTILFWVRNSDKMEHRVVVESRIKQMLGKQGILQILSIFAYLDIHYFHSQILKPNQNNEQFKSQHKKRLTVTGIGQSIGYKQFYDFYFHFRQTLLMKQSTNPEFHQLFQLFKNKQKNYQKIFNVFEKYYQLIQKYLLDMKILQSAQQQLIRDTWAYCKRQITWIRNRIFQKDALLVQRFYILDLAKKQRKYSQNDDPDQNFQQFTKNFDKKDLMERFQTKVHKKAIQIIEEIKKNGYESAYEKFQIHQDQFKEIKLQNKLQNWKKYICKECQVQLNGPNQWDEHLKSKRHLKRLKYLDKRDQIQKWIQSRKKKQEAAKEKKNQKEKEKEKEKENVQGKHQNEQNK